MFDREVQRRPGPAKAFLFLPVLLWGACAERLPPPARVGQRVLLTAEELDRLVEREAAGRGGLPRGFAKTVLTNEVRRRLFVEDARARGYPEKDEVVAELREERRRLVTAAALERAVGRVRVRATLADVRKYRSVLGFRIIVVAAPWSFDRELRRRGEERLRACWAELRAGRDFGEVADRWSDDPANLRGGYLGVFRESELPREWRAAVVGLRPGGLSSVTPVPEGYMLFRLDRVVSPQGGEKAYELSGIRFGPSGRERAEEVRRLLVAEPGRFRELADVHSEDPRNRNGGLVRPSLYGQLPTAVAEAVWRTPVGRFSRPVETSYGWFIVRTESVAPPSASSLRRMRRDRAEMRELLEGIRARKEAAVREGRMERYRRRLWRTASVVRDYGVFTNAEADPAAAASTVVLKLLRENVTFRWPEVAAAMERAAPRRPRTYAEKVAFFETALVFPELVYADGLRRGLLERRPLRTRWKEVEEAVLLRHYVEDLLPEPPSDAELRRWWAEAAPEGLRGRRFEEVRGEAMALWRRREEEAAVRRRFARLVEERKVVLCDLCVSTPQERRLARRRAEVGRVLRRGETNAAVRLMVRMFREAPSWPELVRLASLSSSGHAEAVRLLGEAGVWRTEGLASVLADAAARDVVLRLLAEAGVREAVPQLVGFMRSVDLSAKPAVMRALAALDPVAAAGPVWEAILAERGRPASEAFLVEALAEAEKLADSRMRAEVVRWLRRGERSAKVRVALLRFLATASEAEVLRVVEGFQGDSDALVRQAASEAAKAIRGRIR